MKTRAAVYLEVGQPVVVDEVELPELPAPASGGCRLEQVNEACAALEHGQILGRALIGFT